MYGLQPSPSIAPVAVEMPPFGTPQTQTLDQDALLEALLFMDDVDFSSSAALPPPVKFEEAPPPQMGTFSSQLLGVIPIDMAAPFSPGCLRAASTGTSVHERAKETPQTASLPSSPQASVYSPSSPQASAVSSASPPASPSTGSDSKSKSSTKPKGVVNRSRNRRREELQYLRSLVGELEDRLTTLHKRTDEQNHHNQTKQLTNGSTAAPAVDDPVLTAVWETLASRQYAQRQRAEGENNKLRRMLEDQIQVGKSLERLLKRRHNADDLDVYLHGKRPRRENLALASSSTTVTPWNNAAVYDELLAMLPSMYKELGSVFQNIEFDRSPANFRDVQVRNEAETGVVLDVTEAHVYPFEYKLTAQNFWTLFADRTESDRFHYHDTDCSDDTLKLQFGLTVQVARAEGVFNMKVVSKQYSEVGRTVVVWVGLCDPTEVSETNMDGIFMRYKGWHIIEPLVAPTSGSVSSVGSGTRITSYSIGVPETFEDVPDQKRKVGTLTNFMLSTVDVQISARQQQLENLLVRLSRE